MFMSSALKAQEEHYKLHSTIAAMKAKVNGEIGSPEEAQPTMTPSAEDLIRAQAAGSAALISDTVRTEGLPIVVAVGCSFRMPRYRYKYIVLDCYTAEQPYINSSSHAPHTVHDDAALMFLTGVHKNR